jgi:cytochrome c556
MWKALLAAGLISGLAACDKKPPSSPPTARELKARDFTRAMKAIDKECDGLQEDLDAGKPPEEARRRIAAIRTAAERASTLDYRDTEAENRGLKFEFRTFLDAAGKLENATWEGDDGKRAFRRLAAACATCHDQYKDKDR